MYDIAIPKLYETITIKKDRRNQRQLAYGHSTWFTSRIGRYNRKDSATTFTRKLVFEDTPEIVLKYYRCVEVIVLMPQCFEYKYRLIRLSTRASTEQTNARIARITVMANFAAQVAKNGVSSSPLHVVEHLEGPGHSRFCWHWYRQFHRDSDWAPTTYKAVDYDDFIETGWMGLSDLCAMRSVVRFPVSCGFDSRRLAQLASGINSCLTWTTSLSPPFRMPPGQLFLCGVPALILPPEELVAAGNNANEIAKLKIFDAMSALVINYGTRPTWEAYNSRIHFVDPGFRPTLAELAEEWWI